MLGRLLRCTAGAVPARGLSSKEFNFNPAEEKFDFEQEAETRSSEVERVKGIRRQLLDEALLHTPEFGFSPTALDKAAASLQLSPSLQNGLLRNPRADLALHFYRASNKRLEDHLFQLLEEMVADPDQPRPRQPHFIRDAVKKRLEYLQPVLSHWSRAVVDMTTAGYSLRALGCLQELSDTIWWYAGDQSTDYNWYTKRVLLGGVYKSTELFMLQDKSKDFAATWHFLDARMDNVRVVGQGIRQTTAGLSAVPELVQAGVTVGLNMTGLFPDFRKR